MDPKKMAANKAADLVKDGSSVGIGGGSTMLYLAECIKEKMEEGLELTLYTSSFDTAKFLRQLHLEVLETSLTASLDIYFDGCDQFDKSLNALKSGGGIHTREKLLASMANEFILVGDTSKYVDKFNPAIPLVLEIIPESLLFVQARIEKLYDKPAMALRFQPEKEKPVITANGNWLVDLWFKEWPELSGINAAVKAFTGVLETSLFFNMASRAIMGSDGDVQTVTK
jgi:ribose 5-phosphate isomerase A